MKKTVILGGSFNPFHNGHEAMLKAAMDELHPDECILMPAKKPPHKPSYNYVTDDDRLGMLQAYAQNHPGIIVDTTELYMDGFTYTANTLSLLAEKCPDKEFIFLIGGDSIKNFANWYKPDVIVKHASLAICAREEVDPEEIREIVNNLKLQFGGEYHILNFKEIDVSSTEIREAVEDGKDISALVPAEIAEYIVSHRLYLNHDGMPELSFLCEEMKKSLKPSRYRHSIGVMQTAKELAEIYGCDVKKAEIAGILHDCAKYMHPDELENLCRQNNVELSKTECLDDTTRSSLLHSKAGMILARNIYNVQDEEILSSIFYHTVGKPDMTMLEKIIFVADFIEPGRTQPCKPDLSYLRELVKTDIDRTIYYICQNTVDYLVKSGRAVDDNTTKTLEFYAKACNITI